MSSEIEVNENAPDRWTLIRDVAVFQVKLLVDGLRDLLLVPVSLVLGLISLFSGGQRPGTEFYDLLKVGRRSERWINLFGAVEHMHGPEHHDPDFNTDDMDRIMTRVESFIVDEYRKGGITAKAKDHLDDALDSMIRLRQRKRGDGKGDPESTADQDHAG